MHILIASHACSLPQNQQIFSLAAKQRGWKVTLVLPSNWKNEYGRIHEARLLDGFDAGLITTPVLKTGSVPLHLYRLNMSRLLRDVKPDVVYSHNEAYALSTMQLCRANLVAGKKPFGFFSCQNLVKKYPIPFRQGEAWVYRNSSFFFPITDSVDHVHRQKGYTGKSCVIPLGFDPRSYSATKCVRERHQSSVGTFRLAFIGRVVEEKGLITLAAALGKIQDLDWQFIIVGAGPFQTEVKNALRESGIADRVEWRGFVPHDEVAKFYETVDALILPSETRSNWTEQFGRVLVEAMACGTPVIGSDSGEIPNIIRASRGGLIFKEADVDDCSLALRQIIEDHESRSLMAELGHRFVHDNYALNAIAGRFADAIEAAVL